MKAQTTEHTEINTPRKIEQPELHRMENKGKIQISAQKVSTSASVEVGLKKLIPYSI